MTGISTVTNLPLSSESQLFSFYEFSKVSDQKKREMAALCDNFSTPVCLYFCSNSSLRWWSLGIWTMRVEAGWVSVAVGCLSYRLLWSYSLYSSSTGVKVVLHWSWAWDGPHLTSKGEIAATIRAVINLFFIIRLVSVLQVELSLDVSPRCLRSAGSIRVWICSLNMVKLKYVGRQFPCSLKVLLLFLFLSVSLCFYPLCFFSAAFSTHHCVDWGSGKVSVSTLLYFCNIWCFLQGLLLQRGFSVMLSFTMKM